MSHLWPSHAQWEVTTGAQVALFLGHTAAVCGIAFSPDGTQLASASVDGTARTWLTQVRLYALSKGGVGVSFVCFFSDSRGCWFLFFLYGTV
jgi:WD40 repeat protein